VTVGEDSSGTQFYPDIKTFPVARSGHIYRRIMKPGTRYSVLYHGVRTNWMKNAVGRPTQIAGKDDSLGAFVGTFVGKSDEFKQIVIAALKAKAMSKADFNKAVEAHVKPGASKEEKTAAGEKMLAFLGSKKVIISGDALPPLSREEFREILSKSQTTKHMSRADFDRSPVGAKTLLRYLASQGINVG